MFKSLLMLLLMFSVYAGSMLNLVCPEHGWGRGVAEKTAGFVFLPTRTAGTAACDKGAAGYELCAVIWGMAAR